MFTFEYKTSVYREGVTGIMALSDFKLDLDVRSVENKTYQVTKDIFAIHDTVVKLNLARIDSYVSGTRLKLDYDNENAPSNDIAVCVHASIEVDKVDDLIAYLERIRDRQHQRLDSMAIGGDHKQSLTLASSTSGPDATGRGDGDDDDVVFDDSAGARELGLRIVVRKLAFARVAEHEDLETRHTEAILSRLWTRNVELSEREAILRSPVGGMLIRLCVRYHKSLEYMLVAPYLGQLMSMHLSDIPFLMSFARTQVPLYVPHDLSMHDYLTTVTCQEFVLKTASVRQLRKKFEDDDAMYARNLQAYAAKIADAVGDSRQLCGMLSAGITDHRSELELRPAIWLESRLERPANWARDEDDALSEVVLRVYIWQQPPPTISAMCHLEAVREGITFQQLMARDVPKALNQLMQLMDAGRELVYAIVEEALGVWTKDTLTIRRNREYVQRLLDCSTVTTATGDRLWVHCRTVDVSTSTREVLAVSQNGPRLYKVRSRESSTTEASPIPWMWPSGPSVSDIEHRLRVQVQSVDHICNTPPLQ